MQSTPTTNLCQEQYVARYPYCEFIERLNSIFLTLNTGHIRRGWRPTVRLSSSWPHETSFRISPRPFAAPPAFQSAPATHTLINYSIVYDIVIPYGAENKLFNIYFYYLSEKMSERERRGPGRHLKLPVIDIWSDPWSTIIHGSIFRLSTEHLFKILGRKCHH